MTALSDVSFSIAPGEFICLTGPSGAGKSTVVHLLVRAELPTHGTIEVDGADLAKLPAVILQMYRRRTGVVFQDYKLLSDRTVAENVAFALEVCGEEDAVIAARVPEVLAQLKLTDRAQAFPSELSGGEKTRTALARALVHKPGILITDEPTGNIDPAQSMEIVQLLKEINATGTTVILASHDQIVVDALQTRVLRLEHGKLVRDSAGTYVAPVAAPVTESAAPKPATGYKVHPQRVSHVSQENTKKAAPPQKEESAESSAGQTKGSGSGKIKPIAI